MKNSQHRASVLVTGAIASAVLAVVIGGFLNFVSNEYALNLRSHAWNQALHMAEAGIEAAFAEFNYYYCRGLGSFASSRGWVNMGGGDYLLLVENFRDNAGRRVGTMYSWVRGVGTANPWVSGYGNCPTYPRGPTVWRRVDVGLARGSLYPKGIIAKHRFFIHGENDYEIVYIDSYDSSNPSKSTTNLYDFAKRQANGNVACIGLRAGVGIGIMNLGNGAVYGRVYTGPDCAFFIGPYGSYGPTFNAWERIGPGTWPPRSPPADWFRTDFAVDVPDVTLPAGANSWPSLGMVTNSITLSGGDYQATGIALGLGRHLRITGNVRLYVQNHVSVGKGKIIITENGSLEAYIGGNCTIEGDGIVNNARLPIKCQLYGLPTSYVWSIGGSGNFIGTVYAPQAAVAISGGSGGPEHYQVGTTEFSGSVVASIVSFWPMVRFHYDEALGQAGSNLAGFSMVSWRSWRWDSTASRWVPD